MNVIEKPYKTIKDPVHGYIRVPKVFVDCFIDTAIFQRLRSIEQTSMRWLFPGGRHDRFIHSLGVFHLAVRMYESILRNSESDVRIHEILSDKALKNTFLIAALMHDCAHAPFSHTFEKFYNKSPFGKAHNSAYLALAGIVDQRVKDEFDFVSRTVEHPPAHHEVMSAYVLLKHFGEQMAKCGVTDSTLAARMITGIRHETAANLQMKVENALIGLVNGTALDVDKLDYIVRDTWASGVKNTAIDVDRLVDGATIMRSSESDDATVWFAFKKSSISVVQSMLDARNYLYEWVYGHHTVLYYAELLKMAAADFAAKLSKGDKNNADMVMRRLFSAESFSNPQTLLEGLNETICQVCDGDVLNLFKRYCPESSAYCAYSTHVPIHIPIWKTGAEYRLLVDDRHRNRISSERCVEKIREHFKYSESECFACDDMTMKLYDLKDMAVMIQISDHEALSLTDLAFLPQHPHLADETKSSLFYVFIPKADKARVKDIISFINSIPLGGC